MTNKKRTLEILTEFLEKARRRLSDEEPDYYDMLDDDNYAPEEDLSEFDPDNMEEDDADAWLREHDPEYGSDDDHSFDESTAEEPQVDDFEDSFEAEPELEPEPAPIPEQPKRRMVAPPPPGMGGKVSARMKELQPTREELLAMREYTVPWERRARERAHLEAEPHLNPIRHHKGRIIEARNLAAADRHKAYEEFTNSPEYQNADPITQMEMDAQFHQDWHDKNPDYIKSYLQAHADAHNKGSLARELFLRAKDEKIRHIAGGGINPDAYSVEEGIQHVGGSRDEEDGAPSGVMQDKAAQFAMGNQEFVKDYMENYQKRARKFGSEADLSVFDNETRADIGTVLGDHPALSDPAKKAKVDAFVEKYHPLIARAARRTINKLGLADHINSGQLDYGLLHEAGLHAIFQAVNDYDHDHHSKASFTTHLNRKMHGLMQTALKTQLADIPEDMRIKAKKADQQQRAVNASPVKIYDGEGNLKRIHYPGGEPPKEPQDLEAPATPEPPAAVPEPPKPDPAPVAPVVRRRRPSHEIAAAHGPDVQERLKRIAALKPPNIPGGGDSGEQ